METLPEAQPTAIAERGEHELTLAGTTYRLRPSYAAICAIEKRTGQSQIALIRRGDSAELPLAHLGIIAAELIRAGAEDSLTRAVSADRLGELIFEDGVLPAMGRLTLCLHDAAMGGRTASGEARAAAAPIDQATAA